MRQFVRTKDGASSPSLVQPRSGRTREGATAPSLVCQGVPGPRPTSGRVTAAEAETMTDAPLFPGGGEYSLKISAPQLLRFGIDSVLKILKKRITQWMNESINEWRKGYRTSPATQLLLRRLVGTKLMKYMNMNKHDCEQKCRRFSRREGRKICMTDLGEKNRQWLQPAGLQYEKNRENKGK